MHETARTCPGIIKEHDFVSEECTMLFIDNVFVNNSYYYFYCTMEPENLLKLSLLHGCFSRLLSCTNGIESRKAS